MTGPTDFTPVAEARERAASLATPVTGRERLALADADGRVLADAVTAHRAVPHYERAAMDGYAVRASDTVEAGERSPARLAVDDAVAPKTAVRVDTGAEMPAGADAVVKVEATERVDDDLTVFAAVAPGENVAPVGEDVAAGTTPFEAGHRLRPADLGLLRAVGVDAVAVFRRPDVALVQTGDELVADDPAPGETVATNGLTVGRYVERWGCTVSVRDPVPDDEAALRESIAEAAAGADVVATLGGTSMGDRDRVPAAVESVGDLHVHGVGLRPGHPGGVAAVDDTPVLVLPGYPVGCLVTAMALLRPAVARAARLPVTVPPVTEATLARKIASEPGMRTYARVALDGGTATPTRTRGSGVLSSVTEADGWVVVPESAEGFPAGETVAVENWEAVA